MGNVRVGALCVSSTALFISVRGIVWTWIDTCVTLVPAMDIERDGRANCDVRFTLPGMRIHHESRNNNDVTILCGVVRPRAYCSSVYAV